MAQRHNHYDVAFEEYLRRLRTPYVNVDETRRSLLQNASLKSMDFIVYAPGGPNLLVDVKGRQFPSSSDGGHAWENWATEDDLASLLEWEQVFGPGFRATLVFAYHVVDGRWLGRIEQPFVCRDRVYAFYGVWADDYRREMRTRSASWETVSLPMKAFRRLCTPVSTFLHSSQAIQSA